jgi:hypothetical protein
MPAALLALSLLAGAPMPDWLVGRWGATEAWLKNVELTFARQGDASIRGVLEEVGAEGRRTLWAEYLILPRDAALSLLLNEGERPYECLPGHPRPGPRPDPRKRRPTPPCSYRDKQLDWKKGGGTYQFTAAHPGEHSLRFDLTKGRRAPGMFPIIVELDLQDGKLALRSVFGPQHGAALSRTFVFERKASP